MGSCVRGVVGAAVALALLSGASACAPGGSAVRKDTQGISVRLPPAEAMELGLQAPGRPPLPAPPLSVAEEYRDRWITLFEVTFQPLEASGLPEAGGDAP